MAKKALCIGINDYPGTESDLSGCVNDANDWRDLLKDYGFAVQQLLDAEATKDAMFRSIQQLVQEARYGDVIVITYSGHGSWVLDANGDEPDGRDEVLCPHDISLNRPLSDDELYNIFAERARGVHVALILDACHSGSASRLRPLPPDAVGLKVRFLAPELFLPEPEFQRAMRLPAARTTSRSRPFGGVLLSGCQDNEYSYDAVFNGRPNGAFTFHAIKALGELPADAEYRDWHKAIRTYLPNPLHPQNPNLQGTSTQKAWKVFGQSVRSLEDKMSTQQRSQSRNAIEPLFTEQDLQELLLQVRPGEMLDLADVEPHEADRVLKLVAQANQERSLGRPRNDDFFDLGPHVDVQVNMWWGPFGEARIFFDRVAVDNYDRAITFANLVSVGVPIPAAGIIAGAIRIMVAVASENGLIVWVQLPSLVHTPLPA